MPTVTNNKTKEVLQWRVNMPHLYKELIDNVPQAACMRQPFQILMGIMVELGERAAELNDDQLNALMCRLSIYSIADPYSPDSDKELTKQIIEKGRRK